MSTNNETLRYKNKSNYSPSWDSVVALWKERLLPLCGAGVKRAVGTSPSGAGVKRAPGTSLSGTVSVRIFTTCRCNHSHTLPLFASQQFTLMLHFWPLTALTMS
jgi:hypothetical protein